jgi:hypothetical protein
MAELELIIRPHRFERLAVIPTDMMVDATLSARVPPASGEERSAREPSSRLPRSRFGESPF